MNNYFENAFSKTWEKVSGWGEDLIMMLPNFLVAAIILLFFVLISRLAVSLIRRLFNKFTFVNPAIENLLLAIVKLIIIGTGVFVALEVLQLHKAVTSFLAGAGIIGLALGFAFQDITANFISGIILSIRKPFTIGDIIESQGVFGIVKHLDLRYTIIKTPKGQSVSIPNRKVFQEKFTKFSTGIRRIDLQVGVGYESNLEKVESIATSTIQNLQVVNNQKPVKLYFLNFGASSIDFVIQYWISEHSQQSYLLAKSEGIKAIKKAFDRNNINIPFPIRTLDISPNGKNMLQAVLTETEQNLN